MNKGEIIRSVVARFDCPIRVLEIGRLRNASPGYEVSDGWSTLQFARHPSVSLLVSIDNNPETLAACQNFPKLQVGNVVYGAGLKHVVLDGGPALEIVGATDVLGASLDRRFVPIGIDLLYLDAADDAMETVSHFQVVGSWLSDQAMVLMDDVYSGELAFSARSKGSRLVPQLEGEGWIIEQLGPMALAHREKVFTSTRYAPRTKVEQEAKMRIKCSNPGTASIFNPSFMTEPVHFGRHGLATVSEEVGRKMIEVYRSVEAVEAVSLTAKSKKAKIEKEGDAK